MAADDQIKCQVQVLRQDRTGSRYLAVGAQDYQILDEADPKTSLYINGGAPSGGGITVPGMQVFNPGEFVVVQAKNRMGSAKTLDSAGSPSGKFLLGLEVRDLNTGKVYVKSITEADKSTDLFADDPSLPDGKWADAYAFKVPDGERWGLYGRFQADLRTTA